MKWRDEREFIVTGSNGYEPVEERITVDVGLRARLIERGHRTWLWRVWRRWRTRRYVVSGWEIRED